MNIETTAELVARLRGLEHCDNDIESASNSAAFALERLQSDLARLMAENELLKKDAERYRKLADAVEFGEWGITDGTQGQSVLGLSGDYYLDDKADMDNRIDALPALKGEQK